jgi:alpha/beta superfamily hydrolase
VNILNKEHYDFHVADSHLQGILEYNHSPVDAVVMVLHPHPLYGGDKSNPVVTTMAETFRRFGLATLRFNFRGVASRGEFAGISGAFEDAITASQLLEDQGFKVIGVAGYSFGGSTALRFSSVKKIEFIVSVSSSLDLYQEGGYPTSNLSKITCPILMLHGTSDLTVPFENMTKISSLIQGNVTSIPIENEGHFYHSSLNRLRGEVILFMRNLGFLEQTNG